MNQKSNITKDEHAEKLKQYIERIEKMKEMFGFGYYNSSSDFTNKIESSSSLSTPEYFRNGNSGLSNVLKSYSYLEIDTDAVIPLSIEPQVFGNPSDIFHNLSDKALSSLSSEPQKIRSQRKIKSLSNQNQKISSLLLLLDLPTEILFHILEYLTPFEWMNLEKTSVLLLKLVTRKCKDVVEIDIYEDYIEQQSKKKYRNKQRNFVQLIEFIGNRFTILESLKFNGCNFDVNCPNVISDLGLALPNLKHLEFVREWPNSRGPTVRKRALNGLNRNFVKLETLILNGSVVRDKKDKMPVRICSDGLPNLSVSANIMHLIRKILLYFLHHLQTLSLQSCVISLDFLQQFDRPNRLTNLDVNDLESLNPFLPLVQFILATEILSEVNVSGLGVFQFEALNLLLGLLNLKSLHVLEMGNYQEVEADLPNLTDQIHCENLEAFLVPRALFINYDLLLNVCQSCAKLTSINLSELKFANEEDFYILAQCNKLVDVNLAATNVNDAVIEYLTNKLPQISDLNLRLCKRLTDKSMFSVAKNSKNIANLYLFKKSRFIFPNSIQYVVDKCQSLQFLEVSAAVIDKLDVSKCPHLELSSPTYI